VLGNVRDVLSIVGLFLSTQINKPMAKYTNKTVLLRRAQALASWRELAPEATFAGMTLAQFEASSQESLDIREIIDLAYAKIVNLLIMRNQADQTMHDQLLRIVQDVRSDPAYGDDSGLYKGMGYVRKSERKSGLSRKVKVMTPLTQVA
jgi:hypothetical protein